VPRAAHIFVVLLRASLAAAFIVVGGHEAFVVGDTPARVWGWALMAIGVMLAFGAAFPRRAWGAVAGLVGSAAAAVAAGYVMYAAVSNPDPARPATIALSSITIAAAVVSGVAIGAEVARNDDLRRVVFSAKPIIASVASVGTLLTAAQFLQQSYPAAGAEPPSLNLSVEMTPAKSPRPALSAYALTVRARNAGDQRVGTLGSTCSVIGRRVQAMPARLDRSFDRQTGTQSATEPPLRYRDRAARETYAELVYSEPFLSSFGFYFEPGEETTAHSTVLVRPGEHDLYEAICEVFITRGARLSRVAAGDGADTSAFSWSGGVVGSLGLFGTLHVTRTVAEIPEASWLRAVTRRERRVVAATQVQEESRLAVTASTPLYAFVDGAGRPDREDGLADYTSRVAADYGLAMTSSRATVPAPRVPPERTRPLSDVLRQELRHALGPLSRTFTTLQEPLYAAWRETEYALWLGDELSGATIRRRLIAFERQPGGQWQKLPLGCNLVPEGLLRAWGVLRSAHKKRPLLPECISFDGPPGGASREAAQILVAPNEEMNPLELARPQHFVLALYAAGDRTAATVIDRLTRLGYAGGAVRDRTAGDAEATTFAIAMKDASSAREEAEAERAEFVRGDLAGAWTLSVSRLSDAIGMRTKISPGEYLDLVLVPRGRWLIGVMAHWSGRGGSSSADIAQELAKRAPGVT
jgi:hypothetical protein